MSINGNKYSGETLTDATGIERYIIISPIDSTLTTTANIKGAVTDDWPF